VARLRAAFSAIVAWLRAGDARLMGSGWYRIVRNTIVGFNRRRGQRSAAAMTYFAVFSIFPFILLMIALLSFLVDSAEAQRQVVGALSEFLPVGSTGIQSVIRGVIEARGVAVGFGVVLLLWGALGWFQAIDQGVNEMWGVTASRPFPWGQLFALGMIGGIGLVMMLSWAANIAVGIVRALTESLGLGALPGAAAFWDFVVGSVTMAVMFVLFCLLYRWSPMCDVGWREVWPGALVTAALWSALRSGFAVYVVHFANYQSAYGSIGAVIAFLAWLYLAHMVILFGARLTYTMRLESQGVRDPVDLPCGMAQG